MNERDKEEREAIESMPPLTLQRYFEIMGWSWPPPNPFTAEAVQWIDERMGEKPTKPK